MIDNSQDVCVSQARCATQGHRHRQNAICFMFRKSYNNFRDVCTSQARCATQGRRPLHLFNRINFQNYKALLIYNSQDVEDAVPYTFSIELISKIIRPSDLQFTGRRGRRPLHLFNRINFQNYKVLLIDNSRDVCTSQARCATQGRRPLHFFNRSNFQIIRFC